MTEIPLTTNRLLESFEKALRQRNPVLAERLEPGLPEVRILRLLERAKVDGSVQPIVRLFAWRNGSRLDLSVAQHASPFPYSDYIFMELALMLAHFVGFREGALYHPRMVKLVDRYFPMFWDGSGNYLTVDLHADKHSPVVRINTDSEEDMIQSGYDSFEEFLRAAIRANEKNERLECFK